VPVTTGSTVATKLVVKNRSRRREPSVALSVFANSPTGTPLWTGTVSLRGHGRRTKHLEILVPEGTTSLVAVATCDDDGNPGNNIDSEHVGDDDGGTAPPPVNGYALAGAATFATNCASCHGVDARGTSLGPNIVHRSASDILEAMREGEEGMPRFPEMTSTDARNLAAYLARPRCRDGARDAARAAAGRHDSHVHRADQGAARLELRRLPHRRERAEGHPPLQLRDREHERVGGADRDAGRRDAARQPAARVVGPALRRLDRRRQAAVGDAASTSRG
jgi:cytochrome c553